MDLLQVLQNRIDELPDGEYLRGLKSVLQHIEVASRHLARGQTSSDDTAFTDAIYRTNQAYEGSLKEAYRVLAEKDPERKTPDAIEIYLQDENLLRPRVLSQLTNYRQNLRNPSTHDHRLDFDEDEALLAIVTVSAFAIVLVDQIIERIAFEKARAGSKSVTKEPYSTISFLDDVANLVEEFVVRFVEIPRQPETIHESEIVGSLGGFLLANAPHLRVETQKRVSPESNARADLVLELGDEKVVLEIRRISGNLERRKRDAVFKTTNYMILADTKEAIILLLNQAGNRVTRTERKPLIGEGRIIVLATE